VNGEHSARPVPKDPVFMLPYKAHQPHGRLGLLNSTLSTSAKPRSNALEKKTCFLLCFLCFQSTKYAAGRTYVGHLSEKRQKSF